MDALVADPGLVGGAEGVGSNPGGLVEVGGADAGGIELTGAAFVVAGSGLVAVLVQAVATAITHANRRNPCRRTFTSLLHRVCRITVKTVLPLPTVACNRLVVQ